MVLCFVKIVLKNIFKKIIYNNIKNMATELEMNFLNKLVENQGVEYVETHINDSKSITYDGDYGHDLAKNGMMTDKMFNEMSEKRKINWEHVKQVMDVADEKYGTIGCKAKKELCNEDKKREKMAKIVDLLVEIMKDE